MGDEFDIVTKQGRKDVLEANMCCLLVKALMLGHGYLRMMLRCLALEHDRDRGC